MSPLLLLAGLSGLCFAYIGVAYRLGQSRRMDPMSLAMVLAVVGTVFFGAKCFALTFHELPARAVVCGLLAGLCQYLALRAVKAGLTRGPLSPVWCAVSLGFVPVIVYSRLAFTETVRPMQYAAIFTAIGCVMAATIGQKGSSQVPGGRRTGITGGFAYFAILLVIFLTNGLSNIAMKDLGMRRLPDGATHIARYGDVFLLMLYLVMAGGTFVDLLVTGRLRSPLWWTLGLGGSCGGASVCGMWCLALCAGQSAAIVFTVSCTLSILGAATASVLAFREKPSPAWFATVALAVLTVVLANVPAG